MTYNIAKRFLIHELQLIEVYVEFNGPVLYSAYNIFGQIFLILLIDQGDCYDDFLCLPISLKRLQAARQGLIDLYFVFSQPESFIFKLRDYFDKVDSSIDILSSESLDSGILPSPNTFIRGFSEDFPIDFVKEEQKLSHFAVENNKNALEFKFKLPDLPEFHEIPVLSLAKILTNFQELIFSLIKNKINTRDPYYPILKDMSKFNVFALPSGSFVVKIVSVNKQAKIDIFDNLSSSDIIEDFIYILNSFSDINSFNNHHSSLLSSKASVKLLKDFLKSLLNSGYNLDIFWGSPSLNKGGVSSLSLEKANIIIELIETIQKQEEIRIETIGEFFKIDLEYKRFGFRSIDGKNKYKGDVSPSAFNIFNKASVGLFYKVVIIRAVSDNILEQDYTDKLVTISEYGEFYKQISLTL